MDMIATNKPKAVQLSASEIPLAKAAVFVAASAWASPQQTC